MVLNFEIRLEDLPQESGVYLFKSEKGEVLYVGKAKNLRARISNYFRDSASNPKIYHLLKEAKSLQYFLTSTEKEALLLEATLIKKYRPKYNVLLKDDKSFPFIRISLQDPYPSLQIVRRRKKGDKALYFGPFTSTKGIREILKLLSKTFPLRRCTLAEMQRRKTPCIYYQIKKCLAPCVKKIPKEEYAELVNGIVDFFQGKGQELLEKWKREMHELAEKWEFERAAFLRDRLRDLEFILEKQSVVLTEPKDLDFWERKRVEDKDFYIILFVRYGYLYGYQTFSVKIPLNKESTLNEVLLQYYIDGKVIPETIVITEEIESLEEYAKVLSEYRGNSVNLEFYTNNVQYTYLRELAQKNLQNYINLERKGEESDYEKLAEELKKFLQLEEEPNYIEAIDLSQYGGSARVGALVAFHHGVPEKKKYRHYKIKGVYKDDYTMLYEVVYRRLKRGLEENDLPDLLLIDGGKGHLEVALTAARDLEVTHIDIRSIAKDERRNPEKVYLPGRKNPKLLPKHHRIYRFLGKITHEAHRFALSFSQKTFQKLNFESILDKIPGIGLKRKKILLSNFKDWKEIVDCPLEDLAKLPGFNLKVAKALKDTLIKIELDN
ncbi:MAG: excinuclease ABC subunit UvrC, partial [Caldimicrobium sp.]